MSNGTLDWSRLEDLLQSNENLRAGNRAESDRKVDGPEPEFDSSDPWAIDYKPWPAPVSLGSPNALSHRFRSETSISDVADQIFGTSKKL